MSEASRPPLAPGSAHSDAFISYSHHDRDFVLRLRAVLAERGKAAWQDEAGIRPAERWRPALRRAIEGADALIFVISPQSAASAECVKELDYALSLSKRVIPVTASPVDPAALPPGLSDFQCIPSRGAFGADFAASSDLLASAIDTDLDWVREHTEWTLKALDWDAHRRDASFLLSGSELEEAEHWLARQSGKRPEPSTLDNEFVLDSRRYVTGRLRRTRAIIAVALAVMTALAVVAVAQWRQAVNQRQLAFSRQLAADSLLELSSDPQLSLLLGVQSADVRQTPEALDALRRALPVNHLLRTMQQGDSPLDSAALSPDGKLVATGSANGVVRVWTTGGQLLRVLRGHTVAIQGVTFVATSREVLAWAQDGTARLWGVYGSTPPVVLRAPGYQVLHAAISPDGHLVATSSFAGSPPEVWDAAAGRLRFTLGRNAATVPDVEFSPDGTLIATTSVDGTVSLWNASTGALLHRLHVATSSSPASQVTVNEARFSPDGRLMLVSTADAFGNGPQAQVWSLRTLKPSSALFTGAYASWSPDGKYAITTGPDGNARVWDAVTGGFIRLLHGPDPITGALLSPDGAGDAPLYAMTGSQDGTADLWNPLTGTLVAALAGTAGAVTTAAFGSDAGQVLALTFGSDGGARIWSTGAVVPEAAPVAPGFAVTAAALGGIDSQVPVSSSLAADPAAPLAALYSSGSKSATVIDPRTGARLATFPFPAGERVAVAERHNDVSLDSGGHVMLVTGDGPAQIRAARSGRLLHTLTGPGGLAVSGAMSPDGTLAVTADSSDRMTVWAVSTGARLLAFTRQAVGPTGFNGVSLKFSPDGTLVLSADLKGVTDVWQARTGRVLNVIRGPAPPAGMFEERMGGAISPDGQYVVTTSGWDNDAHVYRVGQPREVLTLRGHSDGIDDATFSPDGTLIATTAGHGICTNAGVGPTCDNSTRVWDLQQSAPVLSLFNDGGTRVDFSADGTSLLVNTLAPYVGGGLGVSAPPMDAFPYDTLACDVCGGFSRLVPLAVRAETRQLTPSERAQFLGT